MYTIHDLLTSLEANFEEYYRLLPSVAEAAEEDSPLTGFVSNLKIVQDEIVDFRVGKILAEEHPYLPSIRTERIQAGHDGEVRQVATAFLCRRAELINTLRALPAESWDRTGVHETEGHISLKELVRRMVEKDQPDIGRLSSELSSGGQPDNGPIE